MSGPLLDVRGLSAWYGQARVLFDVELAVERGGVTALLGRNGAGKSTLLKALMNLVPRRQGAIRFNGRDLARLSTHATARLGLGWVPEDRRVFKGLTVRENLDIGRGPPRRFADGSTGPVWTMAGLMALFPNLAAMPDRLGSRMSGGEQQMLSIARTLMGNPLLLLLDEPAEGVAPVLVEAVAEALLALKREGLAVLLSEQNLTLAQTLADRALVLDRGHVVWQGPIADLAADQALMAELLALG